MACLLAGHKVRHNGRHLPRPRQQHRPGRGHHDGRLGTSSQGHRGDERVLAVPVNAHVQRQGTTVAAYRGRQPNVCHQGVNGF